MSQGEAVRELFPASVPDYAPPPGETLRELLDEQGMTQAELARRAGLSPKHVNQLIQGVVPLSAEVAERLELVTGMPARLWNRLEADYQSIIARNRRHGALAAFTDWAADMPVKELVGREMLPREPKDSVSRVSQMLAFFGVASVDAWSDVYARPAASFRQSTASAVLPGSVAAWLRLGELAARDVPTQPFDEVKLRAALADLRMMTRLPPAEFAPKLRDVCVSAGVALVFVREITGARAFGCTRWLAPDKALVQLSCRYKSDDQFWFTFFHECAHLLLHGKRKLWIEDGERQDPQEVEADSFASDWLIPRRYAPRLAKLRSKADVIAFANEIDVSPGIVVGRLQHDRLWKPKDGNGLKRRFSAEDLETGLITAITSDDT